MKLLLSKKRRRELIKKEINMDVCSGSLFHEESIINEIPKDSPALKLSDWKSYPINEIVKFGWIKASLSQIRTDGEKLIRSFLSLPSVNLASQALCRRSFYESSNREMNKYALTAWLTRVLFKAQQEDQTAEYVSGTITKKYLNQVAKLSKYDDGPFRAKELLANTGIHLVIERHLSGTYLDGCSFLTETGSPIIGLTIRHDRLDNFWFTLLHELSHVYKHLRCSDEYFIDNTEDKHDKSPIEKQADKYAREASIPKQIWRRSNAFHRRTHSSILELAEELEIHPAIIAGRLRYETNDYRSFEDLIGRGYVRKLFPEVNWGGSKKCPK